MANKNANPWNFGTIGTNKLFPIAGNHLFISAYVYLAEASPSRHFTVLSAISKEKPPGGGEWKYSLNVLPQTDARGGPNKMRYMAQYGVGYEGLKQQIGTIGAPLGRWACWEWELQGATNELRFSIDGLPLAGDAVDATKMWLAPKEAQFRFGFNTSHVDSYGSEGYDVWFDEIAIGTQPIGCSDL